LLEYNIMFRWTVVVLMATATAAFAADVRIVEEIAVKVNGDIITRGDIAEREHRIRQSIQQEEHLSGAALEAAVSQQSTNMLRTMIDERLLVHKAKELDIKVDAEVNRSMAQMQVQSGLADPDKFHEWVREQTGMTFEDFKQQTADQYLTQQLVRSEVSSHIVILDDDARKYYEEHKAEFVKKDQVYLSQLLISTQGKTPEQVEVASKKAIDLVARARRGDKFSDLVIANSDDPETSRTGGQLPPAEKGIMRKEIDDIVFNPKNPKGYVTDPIKLTDANKNVTGFLILRIEDRTEAGQASFDEAKEQIQDFLARPKIEPKMRDYLNKLRQEAFLEIKDGYVDTGAVPGKDTRWHEVVGLKPETTTKEEVAAHRKRKKFLGVIAHGSVAPGTKENSASKMPAPQISAATNSTTPEPAPATNSATPEPVPATTQATTPTATLDSAPAATPALVPAPPPAPKPVAAPAGPPLAPGAMPPPTPPILCPSPACKQ
jgi:peptidyl-prolyl cis-trans isomerase SurA